VKGLEQPVDVAPTDEQVDLMVVVVVVVLVVE
jgi:hypothetical protein